MFVLRPGDDQPTNQSTLTLLRPKEQNWFENIFFLQPLQAKYSTDKLQLKKDVHRLIWCWTSSHNILIFSSSLARSWWIKDFIFLGELFLFKYLSEKWHTVKNLQRSHLPVVNYFLPLFGLWKVSHSLRQQQFCLQSCVFAICAADLAIWDHESWQC